MTRDLADSSTPFISQAMNCAIEAYRLPSRHARASRLERDGLLMVIRAAAGDDVTLQNAAAATGLQVSEIRDACKHYLLGILLDPNARGLALLGLPDGAETVEIREHKRWLLKWLHPDRNPSTWEQALFLKVSAVSLDGRETPSHLPVKSQSRRPGGRRARVRREPSAPVWRVVMQLVKPVGLSLGFASLVAWLLMANSPAQSRGFGWLETLFGG